MRRGGSYNLVNRLWVALLILGLAPIPMPVPDFHAVRHSHGDGQDCPMHAHLQRWHAAGDAPSGRSILHFHWAFFAGQGAAESTEGPCADGESSDPLDFEPGDSDEVVTFSVPSRPLLARARAIRRDALHLEAGTNPARLGTGVPPARNFGTTYPPGRSSAARLQRWVC